MQLLGMTNKDSFHEKVGYDLTSLKHILKIVRLIAYDGDIELLEKEKVALKEAAKNLKIDPKTHVN